MTPRLITIPMSHYCEKARWALDHAGISYIEDAHAPLFSRVPTRRAGAPGSVPVLVTDDGTFGDSTDIMKWVDRQKPLYPGDASELEERYDTVLGVAARNVAFPIVERDRVLSKKIALAGVPGWERALGSVFFGFAAGYLRRFYGISQEDAAQRLGDLRFLFGEVGQRLADGRRYLCGSELSAADITFASLAAPVLLPESTSGRLPALDEAPPALRTIADELRQTAAGRFVLRLYAEDRN